MATEGSVPYRIGTVTMIFMLGFAIIADLLQFFLTLTVVLALGSYLVTFLAETILFIWLLLLRVSYFGGKNASKNLVAVGASLITEMIPIIDAVPAITAATAYVIWNSRKEDREKFSSTPK